jgi:hypothetical protein
VVRKSAKVRLSQSTELYKDYKNALIENSREGIFIKDMINRLERGKGLSKKMRSWLDSLIESGVPEPKGDKKLLIETENAISKLMSDFGYTWEVQTLKDFYGYISKGYDLSEKQKNLMNKLITKSKVDFEPSEEQLSNIKHLIKIYDSYSISWKNMRPAVFKAVQLARRFLEGESKLAEWHYEKMKHAMESRLKNFKNAKFKAGDIAWLPKYGNGKKTNIMCTAISDCYLNENGEPVNDWMLCTGEIKSYHQTIVCKRR